MENKPKAAKKPAGAKKAAKKTSSADTKSALVKATPEMMARLGRLIRDRGGDEKLLDILIVESSTLESATALQKKAAEQKAEWDYAKEVAKWKKKSYEATVDELMELLSGETPQLPFKPEALAKPVTAPSTDLAFDKALATATLADLGLNKKQIEALTGDGIKTGADVRKWRAEYPPHKIQGVSEEAAQKIGDALGEWSMKWLAAHSAQGGGALPTRKPEPVADDELALARSKLESAIFGVAKRLAGADGKNAAADKIGRSLTGSADAGGTISKAPLGLVRQWQASLNGASDGELKDIVAGKVPAKSATAEA